MKKEEIIEAEVDCPENNNLPVSQDRIDTATILANINAQAEIFKKLQEYVKDNLVAKTDYYSIRKDAKPSLGKSGAEKINFIFNLVPKYVILSEIHNDSEIAYKLSCDLYNKNSGKFMGSGIGSASSKEDKIEKSMQKQGIKNVQSVDNNVLKMAKKRSYVDATLSSTMASFIFTQDLEDGYLGSDNSDKYKSKGERGELQKLDPKTFKVPFKRSKYLGRTLIECPKWWLESQLKYVEEGKLIPSKFGYDDEEYKKMFREAIGVKEKEDKELKKDLDKEFPTK